jgi:hypothetical protein
MQCHPWSTDPISDADKWRTMEFVDWIIKAGYLSNASTTGVDAMAKRFKVNLDVATRILHDVLTLIDGVREKRQKEGKEEKKSS